MPAGSSAQIDTDDAGLLALLRAIAAGETNEVSRRVSESPTIASQAIRVGASRQVAKPFFLERIGHYVYAGDTGLHIAAAAYHEGTARSLLSNGARPRARNRRGAEPLHYAAGGHPGSPAWDPEAQQAIIELLVETGADADALDNSGVGALHVAVRTRCSAAVRALLRLGADPLLPNTRGSTPLHLAVQNTGRGDTGTDASQHEQRQIILALLHAGARPTDKNAAGKTVEASAASDWIRELLGTS